MEFDDAAKSLQEKQQEEVKAVAEIGAPPY